MQQTTERNDFKKIMEVDSIEQINRCQGMRKTYLGEIKVTDKRFITQIMLKNKLNTY